MSVRVYIAGASRDVERVRWAQRSIALIGAELVHDWTGTLVENEAKLATLDRRDIAEKCIAGVRTCELLWWLASSESTRGAWVELGIAFERANRPIIIVSGTEEQRMQSLFTDAPEVSHHASDNAAVALIAATVRMRKAARS